MRFTWLTRIFIGLGMVIAAVAVSKGDTTPSAYFFTIGFVFVPWLFPLALTMTRRWPRGTALGAFLMLVLEAICYDRAFIHPMSSMAALIYVFKPFIQVLALLPIGILICWRADRRKVTAR